MVVGGAPLLTSVPVDWAMGGGHSWGLSLLLLSVTQAGSPGGCAQSRDGGCYIFETGEDGFAFASALVVQAREALLGGQVVQPLIAAGPFVEAFFEPLCFPSESKWVLRKHKAIGKILGVNYKGYEHAILDLLRDIEAWPLTWKAVTSG